MSRSLREELKTSEYDVIHLYYRRRVAPLVRIEETVVAMARLVEQGRLRYLGLYEVGPDNVRRGHATHPMVALQPEYSLWTRELRRRFCRCVASSVYPMSTMRPLDGGF